MKNFNSLKQNSIYSAILIIVILLSGCGVNSGLMNQYSVNGANTNVVLEKKNFKVVETVSGEATDNYWFFIGGFKQTLVAKAKQKMIENAKLDGTSKAIINVTLEEHNKFMLIYIKRTITVHGTVIEFTE
jgi:PBP1b-binding outer membrane lipoprotein LpoB